ncbi:hypothetical protein [Streptomyces sp. CB01373]|uniref:hypothetical protein n=1 Tax=Streptomyces sp. CB01373 TaxID=2020325 RepID=UPI000C279F8D|nr:hypothetical protein [Streptomyces sp. CB01373]PJM92519.1 hypothetical protein CG719_28090 [Streptomyces sp. CB01373]
MNHPADLVLVFDRDEELAVFPSLPAAEAGLEAIDVADGEFAAFTAEGRIVDLRAPEGAEGPVLVARTEEDGREDLERHLARFWSRRPGHAPLGPEGTARLLLDGGSRAARRGPRRFRNPFRRRRAPRS